MPERSFNSIINLIAGQDTVTAALKRVDSWLLDLNNHAITAGQQLDRLLQKTSQIGGGGQAASGMYGLTSVYQGPTTGIRGSIVPQGDPYWRSLETAGMTGIGGASSMAETRRIALEIELARQAANRQRAAEVPAAAAGEEIAPTYRRATYASVPGRRQAGMFEFQESLAKYNLTEADLEQMRQAKATGLSEYAAYQRQGKEYAGQTAQRATAESERQALEQTGNLAMTAYEKQGASFAILQQKKAEAWAKEQQAIATMGENAMSAYEKQGAAFAVSQQKKIEALELERQKTQQIGESTIAAYEKQGAAFAIQQQKRVEAEQDALAVQQGRRMAGAVVSPQTAQAMALRELKSLSPEEIYKQLANGQMTASEAGQRLNAVFDRQRSSWGGMVGHIVTGMLVWQAMNAVANTVMGTFSTITTETMRLDTASASLAATLGTTKESAKQYSQAMSMMGVAYGMTPEQTLPLAEYAGRVGRGAGAPNQNQLFDVATKLGQRTGEDPKKLMDDLNVTYRQTGISVTTLGDMAVKAWANSGTSANEYLNILREVGPLAKEAGIDIEKMAGISAQAADRMGGSMSDAANTLTRLIKAVTDPNEAQKNVLLRYGIPYGPGTNVQGALTQVSQAGMSAADLAALGGRPGQPAVANDIRTMISTMLQYNGELQKGQGLQQQWNTSTDTAQKALDRLKGAFDAAAQHLLNADWIKGTVNSLTSSVMNPSKDELNTLADRYRRETGRQPFTGVGRGPGNVQTADFADFITKQLPLIRTATDLETLAEAARESARGLSMHQRQFEDTGGAALEGERKKAFVPATIPDFSNVMNVTQYTRAEMQSALRMIPGMFQQEQMAMGRVYKQAGFSQESIDKMLQEFRDKVMGSNVVLQSAGQMQLLQGPQAYYIQQAISAASARDASAGRLEALRDRLAQLRESLDSLNETEKKRAQLEGQWNIPTGAKVLVPLTNESQALIKEHGGETDDQARQKSRESILKQIAAVEEQIRKEEALGTALDALPAPLSEASGAAGQLKVGLENATVALGKFSSMLTIPQPGHAPAAGGSMLDIPQPGKGVPKSSGGMLDIPQPTRTPKDLTGGFDWGALLGGLGGTSQGTGIGSTPVARAIKEGFGNMRADVNVKVSSLPVNITTNVLLDGKEIAQLTQKRIADQVVDQARATGFYSGTT